MSAAPTLLPGEATGPSGRCAAGNDDVGGTSGNDRPMVMFLRRKYITSEADGHVRVEVIRVGDSSEQCSVYFSTEKIGGTSSAGEDDYTPVKDQEVVFPAGETLQSVDVQLVNNDRWEEVELFKVVLSHPHNVRLGPLISARVAIADDDLYPKGCQSTGWSLIKAFLQEQIAERGVKFWKTTAALVYIGMFSTIDALILKLVIDNALGDEQGDPKLALYLAGAYLFFFAISHKCDVMQLDFRGRSGTRKWLRNSLITRFMNMSVRGHEGLSDGDFLNCVYFQVEQLVGDGWYSFLLLIRYGVEIFCNLALQLYIIAFTTTLPIWWILVIFGLSIPAIALTLFCREKRQLALIHTRQVSEDRWVQAINDMVLSRQVIIAYDCVEKVAAEFKVLYEDFYNKHRASRFYQQTSEWIPNWVLAVVLVGMYASAPQLVQTFGISAGDFAAAVKSWQKLKSSVGNFYKCTLKLQRSVVALEKVADVLNRENRYDETLGFQAWQEMQKAQAEGVRKIASKWRRQASSGVNKQLESSIAALFRQTGLKSTGDWSAKGLGPPQITLRDLDYIRIENACFDYEETEELKKAVLAAESQEEHGPILNFASVVIPTSGNMVLVVNDAEATHPLASKRWSKRTLLRLMAGLLYPTCGQLTMPQHKRCVLVDRKPVIVAGDILYNLRFGILPENQKQITDATCWAVAKTLGLSAELIGSVRPVAGAGLEQLTSRDSVAISLARVFLSEPGVVLMDHLGDSLGPEFVQHILRPFLEAYTRGGLRRILEGLPQDERVKQVQAIFASSDLGKMHVETELPAPPDAFPSVIWTSLVVKPRDTDYTLHMRDGKLNLVEPAGFGAAASAIFGGEADEDRVGAPPAAVLQQP